MLHGEEAALIELSQMWRAMTFSLDIFNEQAAPLRFALSNSFAFGGSNVSLLFGARE